MSKNKYPINEGWVHVTIRYNPLFLPANQGEALARLKLVAENTEVARFTRYKRTIKMIYRTKPKQF